MEKVRSRRISEGFAFGPSFYFSIKNANEDHWTKERQDMQTSHSISSAYESGKAVF